jgi:hypothetical protein
MSQPLLRDPIVASGPTRTGSGTGTVTVDRLTHFTTAQTYTLVCIAKSPDTIFSVSGSLDGPVGLAVVGTQFFDSDLKIFLTIQQGGVAFEVGDKFVLRVQNGTDLNQDNIDLYDELPQKNFGVGVKGTSAGDDNIRYSNTAVAAYAYLQGLKFSANAVGPSGNALAVQAVSPAPGTAATSTLQGLTFTSKAANAAANALSVSFAQSVAAVKALVIIQNVSYQAKVAGTAGNSLTVEYTTGAGAGAEVVSVSGNAITVQIASGASTPAQIVAAVNGYAPAFALLSCKISPLGSTGAQFGPVSPTSLTGGAPSSGTAGSEVVTVTGQSISVQCENNASTFAQVKAALDASPAASALITTAINGIQNADPVLGTPTNKVISAAGPSTFTGGVDPYGAAGFEKVSVSGSTIQLFLESGKSTVQAVVNAFNASAAAIALASVSIVGNGFDVMYSPGAATPFQGGLSKFFALNQHELSDASHFFEGNASLKLQDATIQGRANIQKEALLSSKLILDDAGSNPVPDAQQYINDLIEDQVLSIRTADYSKVQWSKPIMSLDADLVIDVNDSGVSNMVDHTLAPFTIPDGSHLYVFLNRQSSGYVTPYVGTDVPAAVNAFRIASRFGDHIIMWDNTLIRDGKAVRIGEGGEGGVVRVDVYDPITTVLPTSSPAVIDGVTVASNMFVLFSNLTAGNNRVYKATVSGSTISWSVQSAYSSGLDPVLGDEVLAQSGTTFGLAHGIWNGTAFKFNDTVRYYTGTDYWELSSLKTQALAASTTGVVFSVQMSGSENMIVDYSIMRGLVKETGTLHITASGAVVAVTTSGAYIGTSGVSFSGDILSGNLRLKYTADSGGGAATMKYFVKRWSDLAGGPGGIPSYATSGATGISAAGANTQIQFNDSGNMGADSDFTWDKTSNTLGLAGLEVSGLSAPVVLSDGTSSPTSAFQYNATNYRFAIIEFSVSRDGVYQVGRMLVTNDGTNASISIDSTSTGNPGITFMAGVVSGMVQIQYLSTTTGLDAQLKYSMRRWS